MSKVKGGDKEKQRLWNPETLKLLKKNGSDLSKPHDIVSVFHIFDIKDIFPKFGFPRLTWNPESEY